MSENRSRFGPKPGDYNPIINLDESPINSDWTRANWPLDRYKSADFMAWLTEQGMTIEQFRQLPMYGFGIERGFIVDDEWAAGADDIAMPWPYPGDEGETE